MHVGKRFVCLLLPGLFVCVLNVYSFVAFLQCLQTHTHTNAIVQSAFCCAMSYVIYLINSLEFYIKINFFSMAKIIFLEFLSEFIFDRGTICVEVGRYICFQPLHYVGCIFNPDSM